MKTERTIQYATPEIEVLEIMIEQCIASSYSSSFEILEEEDEEWM